MFLLLRLVVKREAGAIGISDLLVIVLIADAAQNGLADDYHSIPGGLILVTTIVFWSRVLNWLGYRFPMFQRLVHPDPLPLVRDGRPIRRNMEKELITEGELMSQLRLQGIDSIDKVSAAYGIYGRRWPNQRDRTRHHRWACAGAAWYPTLAGISKRLITRSQSGAEFRISCLGCLTSGVHL